MLQLASLAWAIIASPQRFVLCSLPTGTILVISAIAVGQVRLNTWQGGLHDALQQHEFQAFIAELITFSGIAGALLALVVAQTWLTEMFKVKLRGWLTRDLLDEWLHSKRAYYSALPVKLATIRINASTRTPDISQSCPPI